MLDSQTDCMRSIYIIVSMHVIPLQILTIFYCMYCFKNRGKRMIEGAHINRSLLALGNCINALCKCVSDNMAECCKIYHCMGCN